jgi:hypothetical protein
MANIVITESQLMMIHNRLNEEKVLRGEFTNNLKKFMKNLQNDPLHGELPSLFKDNGIDRNTLINKMIDCGMVSRDEGFDEISESKKHSVHKLSYKFHGQDFENKKDKLYDFLREEGSNNYYYVTSGLESEFFPRYILRKSVYENCIVINYKKPFKNITYYIVSYNAKGKVIDCKLVKETLTSQTSRVILLKRGVDQVNLHIKEANDTNINQSFVLPLTKEKILLSQGFRSLVMLSSMYIFANIIIKIFAKDYSNFFFETSWGLVVGIVIVAIPFLYFVVSSLSLVNQSYREKRGGSVTYEFY